MRCNRPNNKTYLFCPLRRKFNFRPVQSNNSISHFEWPSRISRISTMSSGQSTIIWSLPESSIRSPTSSAYILSLVVCGQNSATTGLELRTQQLPNISVLQDRQWIWIGRSKNVGDYSCDPGSHGSCSGNARTLVYWFDALRFHRLFWTAAFRRRPRWPMFICTLYLQVDELRFWPKRQVFEPSLIIYHGNLCLLFAFR